VISYNSAMSACRDAWEWSVFLLVQLQASWWGDDVFTREMGMGLWVKDGDIADKKWWLFMRSTQKNWD